MLSVRLPLSLGDRLAAYCEATHLSKSVVVQEALEKHLRLVAKSVRQADTENPFTALRGTGNRKISTEQVMQMTRGADWNQA